MNHEWVNTLVKILGPGVPKQRKDICMRYAKIVAVYSTKVSLVMAGNENRQMVHIKSVGKTFDEMFVATPAGEWFVEGLTQSTKQMIGKARKKTKKSGTGVMKQTTKGIVL